MRVYCNIISIFVYIQIFSKKKRKMIPGGTWVLVETWVWVPWLKEVKRRPCGLKWQHLQSPKDDTKTLYMLRCWMEHSSERHFPHEVELCPCVPTIHSQLRQINDLNLSDSESTNIIIWYMLQRQKLYWQTWAYWGPQWLRVAGVWHGNSSNWMQRRKEMGGLQWVFDDWVNECSRWAKK